MKYRKEDLDKELNTRLGKDAEAIAAKEEKAEQDRYDLQEFVVDFGFLESIEVLKDWFNSKHVPYKMPFKLKAGVYVNEERYLIRLEDTESIWFNKKYINFYVTKTVEEPIHDARHPSGYCAGIEHNFGKYGNHKSGIRVDKATRVLKDVLMDIVEKGTSEF